MVVKTLSRNLARARSSLLVIARSLWKEVISGDYKAFWGLWSPPSPCVGKTFVLTALSVANTTIHTRPLFARRGSRQFHSSHTSISFLYPHRSHPQHTTPVFGNQEEYAAVVAAAGETGSTAGCRVESLAVLPVGLGPELGGANARDREKKRQKEWKINANTPAQSNCISLPKRLPTQEAGPERGAMHRRGRTLPPMGYDRRSRLKDSTGFPLSQGAATALTTVTENGRELLSSPPLQAQKVRRGGVDDYGDGKLIPCTHHLVTCVQAQSTESASFLTQFPEVSARDFVDVWVLHIGVVCSCGPPYFTLLGSSIPQAPTTCETAHAELASAHRQGQADVTAGMTSGESNLATPEADLRALRQRSSAVLLDHYIILPAQHYKALEAGSARAQLNKQVAYSSFCSSALQQVVVCRRNCHAKRNLLGSGSYFLPALTLMRTQPSSKAKPTEQHRVVVCVGQDLGNQELWGKACDARLCVCGDGISGSGCEQHACIFYRSVYRWRYQNKSSPWEGAERGSMSVTNQRVD
ncbi:hypothetical protein BaRGS_00009180 [Batillaria attramentaria]|uniref:Uncharacterized protein n=1 Tax=Batillaria attramentaria TaxID=370345 RepID=A0ABD0LK25_9CAEN